MTSGEEELRRGTSGEEELRRGRAPAREHLRGDPRPAVAAARSDLARRGAVDEDLGRRSMGRTRSMAGEDSCRDAELGPDALGEDALHGGAGRRRRADDLRGGAAKPSVVDRRRRWAARSRAKSWREVRASAGGRGRREVRASAGGRGRREVRASAGGAAQAQRRR
jgi:hypothetical protein